VKHWSIIPDRRAHRNDLTSIEMLESLRTPIVQAPLAGGPSTPQLAAAVSDAGALGFVAAGYKSPEAMLEEIAATRALTEQPFGVNVFAATPTEVPEAELDAYAERVRSDTSDTGVEPGSPRSDDDHFEQKCEALLADPVAIVSFTFGCPPSELVERFHNASSEVWVTVTDPGEAETAVEAGVDALIAQGVEAGGHQASFDDSDSGDFGLLALLQLLTAAVDMPLVASGGIANGRGVAAVLCAGAAAAQLGSAFMRCPEAGTAPAHRDALAGQGRTAITRAFSGRRARGIVNRFLVEHSDEAPAAYPAVHHLTAPIRAEARRTGDAELLNLWAGQTHELAQEIPAAELVRRLHQEAVEAAESVSRRLSR
jgi:nitronate monooxygenase